MSNEAVGVGQPLSVGDHHGDAPAPRPQDFGQAAAYHRLAEIGGDHPPGRPDGAGEVDREISRAGTDVQARLALPNARQPHRLPPPGLVLVEAQHGVQEIITRGDLREQILLT